MGRVSSCSLRCQSWGWWERRPNTGILVVSSSAQFEVEHSERDESFFTLSSRLFPSLFILLVKLYLHHNYLIATTCLPSRKTHSLGMSSGAFVNCFLNATLLLRMIPTCGEWGCVFWLSSACRITSHLRSWIHNGWCSVFSQCWLH